MANEFYDHTTYPSQGAAGSSSAMRAELNLIEAGFDKLPTMSGNGGEIVAVNSGGTALEAITTTGTGSGVRADSPTFVTPALGTPSALVGTNITGTATGLTAGAANSVVAGGSLTALFEDMTISATAATGTVNFDVGTQAVLYYTTNAAANWTLNFRWSSGASLDSMLDTGECVTLVFLNTNGATPYYPNVITIDGGAVTPKWQGGVAPVGGNASSVDAYTFVIIKTGSATFTVLASQTRFS